MWCVVKMHKSKEGDGGEDIRGQGVYIYMRVCPMWGRLAPAGESLHSMKAKWRVEREGKPGRKVGSQWKSSLKLWCSQNLRRKSKRSE